LLEIYGHRNVCSSLTGTSFTFSVLDGSICSEYNTGTSVATHISLLRANIVAQMLNPYSKFIVLWLIHVGYCCFQPQLSLGSSFGPVIMTS